MKLSGIARSLALVAGLSAALLVTDAFAQDQNQNRRNQQQQQRMQQMQNQQSGRRAEENALKPGMMAPTFTLQSLDGKDTFDLREYRGERPVVLIFGSYT